MGQHSRLPPDRHGQPAISATYGPGDGCGGYRLTVSPRALSVDRRSGYKTRMKGRRAKKRSTPMEDHLGKVSFYSLQQDLAYFHRPLKTRHHTDRNKYSSRQKNTNKLPTQTQDKEDLTTAV